MSLIKNKTLINARKFSTIQEAQEFCMKIYFDHVKAVDEITCLKIMAIQSHGLRLPDDEEEIKAIEMNIDRFPEIPYDIIIYRGGCMKEKNRPYLSGAFLENMAMKFAVDAAKDLYKIVVKKGAKIIPLFPINQICNIGDPEMEIVFDSEKAIKHWKYYEY